MSNERHRNLDPLLEIKDLRTYFTTESALIRAVDGVSLAIAREQTVGIVGESGCGKSVTALSIARLVPSPPGRIESGQILLRRNESVVDLAGLKANGPEMRSVRGGSIAMIFQEPMRSLTPVYTVGFQIMENLKLHLGLVGDQARARAVSTLRAVGMPDPGARVDYYPHQLSGGMRQRAMIAMALSCEPSLLIADEPTTALDVTIEAQILDLLKALQRRLRMATLFITHDLGVVARMADHVIVMYLGQVMERAPVEILFTNPLHPYTRALFRSMPTMAVAPKSKLHVIAGGVPDPTVQVSGCPFAPRCSRLMDTCSERPPEREVEPAHGVACWLYG